MNNSSLLDPVFLKTIFINGGEVLSRRRNRDEGTNTSKGKMTVEEAGKKGGAKGGPRVRELIEEGKEHENE